MAHIKNKKLVIFGIEDFADIAYEYFTHDSEYEVVAFTVNKAYLKESMKYKLPVIPFEELENHISPNDAHVYVAVVYSKLNRLRRDLCIQAKNKGYILASYVSSRAFVWHNVEIGEHCFIFEDNTIQPFVKIGENLVMWSGNHIGHHSTIGSHIFITSHVVVSGWVEIGNHCFLGVNTTLANNTKIGACSWISHGACLGGNIPENSFVRAKNSDIQQLDEASLFRSLDRASMARSS